MVARRLDQNAASCIPQRDGAGGRNLLHAIAETARAVLAFRERRVELQQSALQETELWCQFALGQNCQSTTDEWKRLGYGRRSAGWLLRAASSRASAASAR